MAFNNMYFLRFVQKFHEIVMSSVDEEWLYSLDVQMHKHLYHNVIP